MIDKCPICGGEIQASIKAYASQCKLGDNWKLKHVVITGFDEVPDVYCENDHSLEKMKAAADSQAPRYTSVLVTDGFEISDLASEATDIRIEQLTRGQAAALVANAETILFDFYCDRLGIDARKALDIAQRRVLVASPDDATKLPVVLVDDGGGTLRFYKIVATPRP